MPTLEELLVKIDASTELLRREMRKGEGSVTGFERNVDRKLGNIDKRFARLGSGIRTALGAFGVGVGVAGIASFTRSVVDAGLEMERFNRSLKFATGSQQDADREMAFLRENAERLGLSLRETVGAYSSLAAAAKGTALEGQNARDIFVAVSEASTVLGLTAAQTEGALRALEQMISKGNVQAEELRGQLGERLPGAFQIAARAMGVTTEELNKMLDSGQVAASDLLPKLAKELRNTFGPDVETAANSAQAAINRFRNSIYELKTALAESGILELLSDFADLGTRIAQGFQITFSPTLEQQLAKVQDDLMALNKLVEANPSGTLGYQAMIESLEAETARLIQAIRERDAALLKLDAPPEAANDPFPIRDIPGPHPGARLSITHRIPGASDAPEPVSLEDVRRVNDALAQLQQQALRSQGRMAEAIRLSADQQIAEWERVAEETPAFAEKAAQAIEYINQRAAEDIEGLLNEVDPTIREFATTFAAAFESRGIDALMNGDLSGAVRGLARDLAELVIRLTVLKPLAEGIGNWFGGLGLFGGTPLGAPKALGGRVNAGTAHLVGEVGPELFVPDVPGRIISNRQMGDMGAANTVVEQHFHIQAGLPPQWQAQLATVAQVASSAAQQSIHKQLGGRR